MDTAKSLADEGMHLLLMASEAEGCVMALEGYEHTRTLPIQVEYERRKVEKAVALDLCPAQGNG